MTRIRVSLDQKQIIWLNNKYKLEIEHNFKIKPTKSDLVTFALFNLKSMVDYKELNLYYNKKLKRIMIKK